MKLAKEIMRFENRTSDDYVITISLREDGSTLYRDHNPKNPTVTRRWVRMQPWVEFRTLKQTRRHYLELGYVEMPVMGRAED